MQPFLTGERILQTFKNGHPLKLVSFCRQLSGVSPPIADRNVRTLHSFPYPSRGRVIVGLVWANAAFFEMPLY